jgi:hypothetical protein
LLFQQATGCTSWISKVGWCFTFSRTEENQSHNSKNAGDPTITISITFLIDSFLDLVLLNLQMMEFLVPPFAKPSSSDKILFV